MLLPKEKQKYPKTYLLKRSLSPWILTEPKKKILYFSVQFKRLLNKFLTPNKILNYKKW